MSAKADQHPPLRLTVDRETAAEGAAEGTAEGATACDPVAELARALLDGGAATCITDRRGELIHANAAYERIAEAVAEDTGRQAISRHLAQAADLEGPEAEVAFEIADTIRASMGLTWAEVGFRSAA